ncbi:MAG: 1,4-alpha-glucan branching protein GlgB [Lachnospiraceae bacterium]|nr:1,4-alpha-glucan branching protein GlgB [Lachnospiraceae bacterium]
MLKKQAHELTEMDQYLFGQGTHYDIYKKLGAHMVEKNGIKGVQFALWAPNAKKVSVVGEFNHWDKTVHPMKRTYEIGFWELFIPDIEEGMLYKYNINNYHNRDVLKADPFGNSMEMRPGNASKVTSIEGFTWQDQQWMKNRKNLDTTKEPMFIYEVHPGSWMKHPYTIDNPQGFYNYKEFAHRLTDYILEMGYTHVELIGIAEHPFDGSWGYQVTNYYAPTSRHGSPEEFMYLVNYLHKHGIGVILDWVPAHFPKDEYGLAEFDGTCQYEYANYLKGNHPQWGTKIFDYGKNEVKNFLIANALYWIREYHIDGLRVDAVASMLYLDFCRGPEQWEPNVLGDNRNLEAIEFIKHLNSIVDKKGDGAIIIAEESTAWPKVTGKTEDGGLGFHFKWNMGWMNDFLAYMEMDPIYRQYHHNKMNFSMMYAYKENYIQVLSHDEVVHLKHSMLEKMPGPIWDKFANLKGAYTFMTGHPGKKLLFMGQEFGQEREWSEERELDWYLLQNSRHSSLQLYMKDLIHIYRTYPCLYELDCEEEGFTWVNADDNERSIFSFERYAQNSKKSLLFICNFTPVNRMDYRVGAYKNTNYTLILNSDDIKYGGGGMHPVEDTKYKAEKVSADDRDYSFAFPLPAYAAVVFEFERKKQKKKVKNNSKKKVLIKVECD